MRISDWSSDVRSSDLASERAVGEPVHSAVRVAHRRTFMAAGGTKPEREGNCPSRRRAVRDRKSVVLGTSVSVRVDLGGSRISKKKTMKLSVHTHDIYTDK